MYTPQASQYTLELYASNQDEEASKQDKQQFRKIGNYLIKSDRGCPDLKPFPKADRNGQIGTMDEVMSARKSWVEPVSHLCPLVEWEEQGEMIVHMRILEVDYLHLYP